MNQHIILFLASLAVFVSADSDSVLRTEKDSVLRTENDSVIRTEKDSVLKRVIRGTPDCKYEKGDAWSDCDPSSGFQKRSLKLKADPSNAPSCEPVKHMSRPCKAKETKEETPKVSANCRYTKGNWSVCHEGLRNRSDTLREPVEGCETQKVVTKKCKGGVCRYLKGEWTPCENDVKKKIMALAPGSGPDCEKTRTLTKSCGGTSGRKKTRANRKQPSSSS